MRNCNHGRHPQETSASTPANPGGERRRIAVVGCGHVGAVTAACLAQLGHAVRGIDVIGERIAALSRGEVEFLEPGLAELIVENLASGRLRFTDVYADGLAGAEFVFLCVNTPSTWTGAADLRNVRLAVSQIAEALAGSEARPLIVNKSTSPIGKAETIEVVLAQTFAEVADRPRIVANPEFLREGSAIADFLRPERVVVGALEPQDARAVAALYRDVEAPVILTDPRTAEMIKYVSNAFLATRVSFINEVARLCEALDVNIDTVVHGVALDPRIGASHFGPGVGYGGSCLPKDVAALCHSGESASVPMRLLQAVQAVNLAQRKHAVNTIRRALGRLEGKTIAVWGVSFEGSSEDLRDSPALDVIGLLRNEGARVRAYDPSLAGSERCDLVDELCGNELAAAEGADAVAVLTDWPEFAAVDLPALRGVMAGQLVYDGRNLLRREVVEAGGSTTVA
jgi:UDPglucose 6-dehydrogenase